MTCKHTRPPACLLLCLLCFLLQTSFAATAMSEIQYSGGSPVCQSSDCQPGLYCMDSFECDTSKTWENGTRSFADPIDIKGSYLTGITVTVTGTFGCGKPPPLAPALPPVVHVYLAGEWLGDVAIVLTSNCTCLNCASMWPYNIYRDPNKQPEPKVWDAYKIGENNTLQVYGGKDLPICLSSVAIFLAFTPGNTSTLTSTSHSMSTITLTSTSGSTTNGTTDNQSHSLVVVGAVMLSGMVFVNMCVVGGWYALKKKPEEDAEAGKSPTDTTLLDKQIHYKDIQMGERIGRGSFGEVYTAIWFQTRVAVKKLPPEMLRQNTSVLEEFTREITLLKSLRHPNVLQFIGACMIPPNVCLVTEFMPRGDLHKIIHDKSIPLDKNLMKSILIDVSCGINYLHSSNPVVIHRDLKSHNVLIGEHWNAKVADFGLCKIIQSWEETSKFTPCGTPKWAAPEVLRNEPYTTKADVYSFAIILWEISTRLDPFPGMSAFELIVQVGKHGLRPGVVSDTNPLCNLILECWEDNPAKRPSFERILAILEAW